MKTNYLKVLLILVLGAALGIGMTSWNTDGSVGLGGGTEARTNKTGNLISHATTTGSAICGVECPVEVLSLDNSRRYAYFQNNSATDIFLYATTTNLDETGTGADRTSTTSISILNGILLEAKKAGAPVATYEVDPDNLVYGYWYASSTLAGVELIVNYK